MYYVSGANLYGQWFISSKNKSIFENFETVTYQCVNDAKFDLTRAKLVASCWSYNIFQVEDTFFIIGTWKGKDNQIVKVPILEQCQKSKNSSLLTVGNDYMLILAEVTSRSVWFYDFNSDFLKQVNITEKPILDNEAKKLRTTDDFVKIIATNNIYSYLTSGGNLYTGPLPSYVDTTHCIGKVCDIACGYEHYVLLTDEGKVYTWGNGRRLQLGHGDMTNIEIPTEVEALSGIKIVKITAGGWHSLALSEYGDLYAWGWNDTGQLGVDKNDQDNAETKKNNAIPTLVDIFDENGQEVELIIKDIACGTRHSAIFLEDDTVWTTGWNKYGQLGFSPGLYEELDCFTKSFYCPNISNISCGPWNTIVEVIS